VLSFERMISSEKVINPLLQEDLVQCLMEVELLIIGIMKKVVGEVFR